MPALKIAPGCRAHAKHTPRPLTYEWHHVVPRAWQHAWTPEGAVLVRDHGYEPVWHIEGELLCPTGHRNTHQCIVALMHGQPAPGSAVEIRIAQRALDGFTAAGGNLDLLRGLKLYGEA